MTLSSFNAPIPPAELVVPYVFEPPAREFSAIIFDCDGTLADSMPLHFSAWRAALAAAKAPFEFSWELFMSRAGKTLEVTVAELNEQFGTALDVAWVCALQRQQYQALLPEVGPVTSVVEFARSQLGRVPFAVASGGDRSTVLRTLEALEILPWFPVVTTAEEVTWGKPAPDLFLLAASKLGVPATACVVFEDSLLGIEAAERAGMGSVLVSRLQPASVKLSTRTG